MLSSLRISFFIFPPFEAVCCSGANYTNRFRAFSVYHNEQALAIRETYGHPPLFIFRMIGIGNGDRQGISQNSGGLSKIDSVFSQILPRLAFTHSNLIGIRGLSRSAV